MQYGLFLNDIDELTRAIYMISTDYTVQDLVEALFSIPGLVFG